ncbi:MAG: MopE-related protein [Bacteroidota bacterium]
MKAIYVLVLFLSCLSSYSQVLTYYRDADSDTYGNPSMSQTSSTGQPVGFVLDNTDCNDANPSINPGAAEIIADGIDQNCNGMEVCFIDIDNDGYRLNSTSTINSANLSCFDSGEASYSDPVGDCNDNNSNINPGSLEICNGLDDDCDGFIDEGTTTTYYRDFDADGFGMASSGTTVACSAPSGYVSNNMDCHDGNATMYPGATEIIGDGIDQNCNAMEVCYADVDNDGYRPNSTSTVNSSDMDCADAGEAVVSDPVGDCNDNNSNIYPGRMEICNGLDDDCDGFVDEGTTTTFYRDFDADGYGMASSGTTVACSAPSGYVPNNMDCHDGNASMYPGATEIIGDGIDQNCTATEVCYADVDNDGYRPNSTSTVNSSDMDCADAGEAVVSDPVGDCNDNNSNIYPGRMEICNGLDDNCDGFIDEGTTTTFYRDFDADSYGMASSGTTVACSAPSGYVSNNTDCNDGDANSYPGATEIIGDGIDQNCNAMEVCYVDFDNDGYRPNSTSTVNSSDMDCNDAGEAVNTDPIDDCNDNDFNSNPGVVDICNGLDDNCNSLIDEGLTTTYYRDFDTDGYGMSSSGTIEACTAPTGYVANNNDCNDGDINIHPAAVEICDGANVDENCNGSADDNDASAINTTIFYLDADGDSFGVTSNSISKCDPIGSYSVTVAGDCDDSNANINPNSLEITNGLDDNCDGNVDELITSIIELAPTDRIYFYPNPASDKVTVVGITAKTKYQIINYLGAVVKEECLDEENSSISIESLSNGLYYLKLVNAKAIKLVKE